MDDVSPFTASSGHVIEDIRGDGNTYIGISVSGSGNIIRRNQVVNTGGSTVQSVNIGILGTGPQTRILENDITVDKINTGDAYGIDLNLASSSIVARNTITSNTISTFPYFFTGIGVFASSYGVLVQSNSIAGEAGVGIGEYGLYVANSTAKCRDNFFGPTSSGLGGCTNVANNN